MGGPGRAALQCSFKRDGDSGFGTVPPPSACQEHPNPELAGLVLGGRAARWTLPAEPTRQVGMASIGSPPHTPEQATWNPSLSPETFSDQWGLIRKRGV